MSGPAGGDPFDYSRLNPNPSAAFSKDSLIMSTTSTPTPSADSGRQILHIGIGAFHRAHQAWYLNRLMEQGDTEWSLAAANIRNDMNAVLDGLAAQQGRYTLETVSPSGERKYETIRAIRNVVPWDPELSGLIKAGADARTRIISFTVTEGGYYLDQQHRLDPSSHPDLDADLKDGTLRTIYGAVSAILRARIKGCATPVTLLNCDNLRSNGERFRSGLLEFLERRGETDLRQWVLDNTTCPNSMVDRITPRSSEEVRQRVKEATGFDDLCPIASEVYCQWVIEDDFCAGRPAFEKAGAEMVESVLPYEEAKIRILNASHSCFAWAGTLSGLQYIHEDTANPAIRQFAFDYVTDDAIPCLSPSPIDLARYRDVVIERFSNPYIKDTNQRVTADGFSKIPGFIAPTIHELHAKGASLASTAILPALFFQFLLRWHQGRLPYTYQDSVMDEAAAHAFFTADDPVAAFSADRVLWGPLAGDQVLTAAIRAAVARVQAWESARA